MRKFEDNTERNMEILDGDEVRKDLSRDIGLSREDREEHARHVSYLARVLSRNEVISTVAPISPHKISRDSARELIGKDRFVEVYVKASAASCEKRDSKELYARARKGEIKNMTGIDDAYEVRGSPDITIDTEAGDPEGSVECLIEKLKDRGNDALTKETFFSTLGLTERATQLF
jgi:adenylylsulfate kinase